MGPFDRARFRPSRDAALSGACMLRVGLIADTHDLLRPEAIAVLRGCAFIVHAGDVCGPAVLQALRELAPVTAVRGNNDSGEWARSLPTTGTLEAGGARICVIHDLAELDKSLSGVRVVVHGHSHRPTAAERDGVLFVNPGSAGPRRFKLPVTVAELLIGDGSIRALFHPLAAAPQGHAD